MVGDTKFVQLCTTAVMLKMSFNAGTLFIKDPDNRVPNKIKIVINLEGTLEEAEGCMATHCVQLVGLHCKHFVLIQNHLPVLKGRHSVGPHCLHT